MSYGVKRCKFFKNGDINFPGLSMIISENIYRNYQSLLNELSTKLVLSTGPVNYLFDYDSGKIILSLDEVKTGKYFIASTSSYLKETQYIDNDIALNWKGSTSSGISGLSFQSSTTIKSSNTLTSPVSSSSLNNFNSNIQNDNGFNENTIVNTSFQNDYCIKPRIINVIRLNEKSKHANFLLNHRSATSLEYVLNELSLFPQLGKVDKLYTKDGKKVAELKDLFGASLTFFAAKYFEKFNITEPNSKPMRINNNKDVYTPKSCSPIVSSKISIKGGSANTTPISYEKNRNNEKEKYRIITTLGEGNYSRIQKAQICSTGQFVVLKRIKRTMMKPIHTNESNILRDLENPYIIKMFDFIESPSEIIIVLDFSQQGDLHSLLNANKINQNLLLNICEDVLNGLKYIHSMYIIHRDLKLENILAFSFENNKSIFKICDFGLATKISSENPNYLLFDICGTLLYTAPEILNKTGYSYGVDTWAFGVIIYVILYGRFPFEGNDDISILENIRNCNLLFPYSLTNIEIIDERCILFKNIIKNTLKKDYWSRMDPIGLLQFISEN